MKKKKLCAFLLCIVMLMAMLPATLSAEAAVVSYINSDIITDTTLPAGTYYICKTDDNREPRVVKGVTLTIESGARVYFGDRVNETVPGTSDKYPYSYLMVNGTLDATGVTFTTVPDTVGSTAWRDAGWTGIKAKSLDSEKSTNLSFTDCTFEYCSGAGTLSGEDRNEGGDGQTVNISVSGCTFKDPLKKVSDGLYAAIRYNNGYHLAGKGNLTVTNTNITGYSHGVLVEGNAHDDINISIDNCVFDSIGIIPVQIHSGLSASMTNCTFNGIQTIRDGVANIFSDYEESNKDQTVTLTGNTFNGDATTNKYPVVVGANARINENVTGDVGNTFSEAYPADYRYIRLIGGIGNGSTAYENAVWGFADIPYLMTNDVRVYENGVKDDGIHSSLVIKPGVTVCFDKEVGLRIEGELSAIGEAEKPITFQKKSGADWCFGLRAGGSLEGPISLKYCNFIGLNSGINIEAKSEAATPPAIMVDNCTIESVNYQTNLKGKNITVTGSNFTGLGIDLDYGQDVSLTDCAISVNAGSEDGVSIEYGKDITLQGCNITASQGCGMDGVSIYKSEHVVLKNCLVAGFPNYGVLVNRNLCATTEEGAPLLENCTVATNGKAGVVFGRYADNENAYGAFIKNCIIAENGNALPDGELKLDIVRTNTYSLTIPEGSISCSLIGRDKAPFTEETLYVSSHYEHPTFGRIYPVPETAYISRVGGPALFADATNGDYHLKSEVGRWNGSTWVTDSVTSNCINAGEPTSSYANEPAPNGARVNIGCYGNTTEASKSDAVSMSYTVTLPDGKIEGGWTAFAAAAYGESSSPLARGGNFSFTITVGKAFYKTEAFKVKVNGVELAAVEGVYTIENITEDKTISVEGVARIDSPTITTQPADQSVTVGQEAVFSIVASGYNVTYSWRVSKDGGSTWENISGATGAVYTISSPTLSQSGWKYHCIATSATADGSSRYSRISYTAILAVTDAGTRYTISTTASPAEGGTVSGGGSVSAGVSATVTATPNANYRFVRWEGNGTQVSTSTSYTFNATADRTLVAVFESTQSWENPFADVKGADWFYDEVRFAYENGLMVGTGSTTFSPETNTSRGMIVTILWRLEGEPVSAKAMTFTDVQEGKWYYGAVAWASEKGIVNGYDTQSFGPEENITREQMAKILFSYASYKGYDVSARDDLSAFTDSPSSWALESMRWAVAEGLFQGKGNGLLDPRASTKRCESAAILQRFIVRY